jgi:hypothetical protein
MEIYTYQAPARGTSIPRGGESAQPERTSTPHGVRMPVAEIQTSHKTDLIRSIVIISDNLYMYIKNPHGISFNV